MAVNNLNSGVGIQPTIVDAKGDLIAATANDAVNRLAVGTNGQVLVADSGETTGLKWNNPGTVGGLVHIKTESFSAVTNVIFNDVFTSDYTNYRIIITINTAVSSATSVFCRVRAGGTNLTANLYQFQRLTASSTTLTGLRGSNENAFFLLNELGGSPTRTGHIIMDIMQPQKTLVTFMDILSQSYDPAPISTRYTAAVANLSSYDGFNFGSANGTTTITGEARVYGYKD